MKNMQGFKTAQPSSQLYCHSSFLLRCVVPFVTLLFAYIPLLFFFVYLFVCNKVVPFWCWQVCVCADETERLCFETGEMTPTGTQPPGCVILGTFTIPLPFFIKKMGLI